MYPRRRAERTYLPGGTPAKAKTPSASVTSTRPESGVLGLLRESEGFTQTDARASGCPVIASMTLPLIRNVDGVTGAGGEAGGTGTCGKNVISKRTASNVWT